MFITTLLLAKADAKLQLIIAEQCLAGTISVATVKQQCKPASRLLLVLLKPALVHLQSAQLQ